MFKNPFSFRGRIRRFEFGLSIIIYWSMIVTIGLLFYAFGNLGSIFFILIVPSLWFLWAQSAKRCHDRNNSGWFQLIPFYAFWMLFADGVAGSNQYGSDPKRRAALQTSLA